MVIHSSPQKCYILKIGLGKRNITLTQVEKGSESFCKGWFRNLTPKYISKGLQTLI